MTSRTSRLFVLLIPMLCAVACASTPARSGTAGEVVAGAGEKKAPAPTGGEEAAPEEKAAPAEPTSPPPF